MTDRDFVFPLKLAPTVSCLSFISHPSKSISAQRPHQCCGLKVYISPRIHLFFFLSKSQAVSTWTSFILAQKALSCKRNSKKGPHAQTSMSVVKYTLTIFTGVHMRGPHMHIYRHFLSCHLFKTCSVASVQLLYLWYPTCRLESQCDCVVRLPQLKAKMTFLKRRLLMNFSKS